MPFNINSFKQNALVYGGARPSLFNVVLTVPQNIGISTTSVSKFSFVCQSAQLPASSVGNFAVPYFGRQIKLAGDRVFADWSVNIMNDEDFSVRSMFESWSNAINRLVSNVRDPNISAEQYKTDLDVIQYSKDGSIIRAYQFVGAFPTEVGAIALDWGSQNAIETFPVNFSYDYWVPTIEQSDKLSGGTNPYQAAALIDGPQGP